jgi:hypothetical protein
MKQRRKRGENLLTGSNKEIFTLTMCLLLAIFLTGGLASNLFFILFILLFGVVFIFEPVTVFVLLAGLLVVFLPSVSQGDLSSNLIRLGSVALVTPIAYFVGKEFQRRSAVNREIRDKTGQIIEDAEVLRSKEANTDSFEELDDIEENAKELRKTGDI